MPTWGRRLPAPRSTSQYPSRSPATAACCYAAKICPEWWRSNGSKGEPTAALHTPGWTTMAALFRATPRLRGRCFLVCLLTVGPALAKAQSEPEYQVHVEKDLMV